MLLVSPVARLAGDSSSIVAGVLGQVALWSLCAVVICVVVCWEKKPLASLWLKPFQWQSLVWAGALMTGSIALFFPLSVWVRRKLGLPGFLSAMEMEVASQVWLRIVAVVTA